MPKSWQEIEFLDYKERQVRRRSQRTRELEQLGTGQAFEKSRLVKLVVGGVFFLAILGGGIFAYRAYSLGGTVSTGSRQVLHVQSVAGEAEVSTSSSGWEPVKAGAAISTGCHLRTGKNGKIVLRPSLTDSRVVLYENSSLIFDKVQLSTRSPNSAAFSFEMEKGEAVLDFQKGAPVTKLVMPLVTVWSQLVRYKARVGKDDNRVLVTRFAVQCEDRADATRKVIVADGEELVSTLKEAIPKPRGAGGAALRERWD